MQTPDFLAAVPAEMRELSASRQTWYVGRHGDRIYWVYTPASYRAGTAVPLIMVLHGCAQPFFSHPWAIAYDTHMNQLAEAHQFLVVYPHEFAPPDVNPESCWNFFLPENHHRDEGEPASLAGIAQDMLTNTSRWTIDQQRIYVAGISSGGGATANLGAAYPDLFAAIAVHSGAEYGYPLPFLGEQVSARDALAPLSEAEALSGEVEAEQLAVVPPDLIPSSRERKPSRPWGPSRGWCRPSSSTGPLITSLTPLTAARSPSNGSPPITWPPRGTSRPPSSIPAAP
jgi:poly(hydroxyalkanoate) depolymerase family esterase